MKQVYLKFLLIILFIAASAAVLAPHTFAQNNNNQWRIQQQEQMRRQQEQMRQQQEAMRRQQEQVRRQQEAMRRQKQQMDQQRKTMDQQKQLQQKSIKKQQDLTKKNKKLQQKKTLTKEQERAEMRRFHQQQKQQKGQIQQKQAAKNALKKQNIKKQQQLDAVNKKSVTERLSKLKRDKAKKDQARKKKLQAEKKKKEKKNNEQLLKQSHNNVAQSSQPKKEGCCCFSAGTPVLAENGLVAIETLKVGDKVYARNPTTGKTELKPVTETFITKGKSLYELTLLNRENEEEVIRVTDNHPFWVSESGWIDSANLASGMKIGQYDNKILTVVSLINTGNIEDTFNITVANHHTYFAGDNLAFVHNCDCVKKSAVQIAREGGKHSGFLKNYLDKTPTQLRRGIASLQKQIDEHTALLKDPAGTMKKLGKGDWNALDSRQQKALLEKKWPSDIQRQKEHQDILKTLLNGD